MTGSENDYVTVMQYNSSRIGNPAKVLLGLWWISYELLYEAAQHG